MEIDRWIDRGRQGGIGEKKRRERMDKRKDEKERRHSERGEGERR